MLYCTTQTQSCKEKKAVNPPLKTTVDVHRNIVVCVSVFATVTFNFTIVV